MNEKTQKKEPVAQNWLETVMPKLKAGVTVKIHQKIKEKNTKGEDKNRIQIFEGIIISRRGGKEKNATITVRRIASGGIGVERIFPIHSPAIAQIEIAKEAQVRRAKLYFLRHHNRNLKETNLA